MDFGAFFAAIGAVVAAGAGVTIIVRELRRRDRRQSAKEIGELEEEIHRLRAAVIALRHYAFQLGELLADRGVDPPPPPYEPHAQPDDLGSGVLRDEWDAHVRGRLRRDRRRDGEPGDNDPR